MRHKYLGIILFFMFTLAFLMPSFAQENKDDIASLKEEVQVLKKQCQEYKELNSKLSERLDALEKKLEAPLTKETVISPSQLTERVGKLEKELQVVKETATAEATDNPVTGKVTLPDIGKLALPDYLTRGFYFSGYFRSGAGGNSRGGKMEAFQAPDTAAKYRLGNEQETYLEAIFTEKNWNYDPDGVSVLTQIRVSYKTQQNQHEDTGISNSAPPSSVAAVKADKVLLREMYAQMGRFIPTDMEAKVWAGERFYRLPELDINDFWWSDMSGYGGGFEDLNFFNLGKLNIAYIGYASNDLNQKTNHGRYYKNNLHFMLKDVSVPAGKGTFWINGGYMSGGEYNGSKYPNLGGVDIGMMHNSGKPERNNQLGLQLGYGVNSSLSAAANIPPSNNDRNAWTFRQTDMFNYKFNDRLSMQVVDVLQYADSGASSRAKTLWASLGMRPVVALGKFLSLEIEPGVDYVSKPASNSNSYLFKFTTALRLAPGGAVDAHPRFRLYATYAQWGKDFKDKDIGGSGFNGQSDGFNFGIQAEHWW
ncbi:MAG: carbohydrate porin [Candidatus Omnitrophica bacterium]|nr:carbohydrate porin [Candidatus Omnitrophota bacterium]